MIKRVLPILFIVISFPGLAQDENKDYVIKKFETIISPAVDVVCEIIITTYKEDKTVSKKEFIWFADSETDQFLLMCVSPPGEQGFAYIKRKEKIWTYSPVTGTFFTTAPFDFIEGTGVRIEDFLPRRYSEDYIIENTYKTSIGNIPAIKFILEPASGTAHHQGATIWFDEKTQLLLKEEIYDSDMHLLKDIMYAQYREYDGWIQPASIRITDKMRGTLYSYIQITKTTLSPIPEYIFTRSYVEFITQ